MTLFISLTILAFVNSVFSLIWVKVFLSKNATISSPKVFTKFKEMARFQMYQSLVHNSLLVGTILSGLYGVFISDEINHILFSFLQVSLFLFEFIMKSPQDEARNMNIWDESKNDEYRDICNRWIKSSLPNF